MHDVGQTIQKLLCSKWNVPTPQEERVYSTMEFTKLIIVDPNGIAEVTFVAVQ